VPVKINKRVRIHRENKSPAGLPPGSIPNPGSPLSRDAGIIHQ
jgi:hypothetical protein